MKIYPNSNIIRTAVQNEAKLTQTLIFESLKFIRSFIAMKVIVDWSENAQKLIEA